MTADAWKAPARLLVERLARRCKEHPRVEEDPVCVIETEKERMLAEIERAEDVEIPRQAVTPVEVRGRKRQRVPA